MDDEPMQCPWCDGDRLVDGGPSQVRCLDCDRTTDAETAANLAETFRNGTS